MKLKKIIALSVTAVMALGIFAGCDAIGGGGGGAQAAAYPARAVAVVVPFTAGGGTDLVARGISEAAREFFPNGISVENRTGAGGAIGLSSGATAAPDGYTITTLTVESVTLPHMGTGVEFDGDSFIPIIMLNEAVSVISVNADSDFQTLEDLIEASRTSPVLIGNSGVGAIWHLAAAALEQESGAHFTHVPFEGAADAITSLMGGHIDAIPVSYSEVSSHVAAGTLRVLSVNGPNRLPSIPDVPTSGELGYDVQVSAWRGMAVPTGTPDDIVDYLYNAFSTAAASPEFQEFMTNSNLTIDIMGPEAYGERVRRDSALFGALIENLGLAN